MSCSKCGALFSSQDQLSAHQQLYCMFAPPMAIFQGAPEPGQAKSPPPGDSQEGGIRLNLPKKTGSHMYKHLLESFGFDLVMQYNESHQRRQRQQREAEEKAASEAQTPPPLPAQSGPEEQSTEMPPTVEVAADATESKAEEETETNLPEVSKSTCQHCNKEFSSVWVLKSHCEEVHKDLVPLEFLEKYTQQFKTEYEKKTVVVTAATSSTINTMPRVSTPPATTPTTTAATSSSPVETATPEKEFDSKEALHAKLNLQTPPEATSTAPSTPTSSTTPASSTEYSGHERH